MEGPAGRCQSRRPDSLVMGEKCQEMGGGSSGEPWPVYEKGSAPVECAGWAGPSRGSPGLPQGQSPQ